MRYDKGHKEETRRRIIDVAAAEFRGKGIDGIGVADLMKTAGLTHGGFYSHFSSKEELVRESLSAASIISRTRFRKNCELYHGLEGMIRFYLRPEHRDHPERGCAAAALAAEVARQPQETRAVFTENLNQVLEVIADYLPPEKPLAARQKTARAIFATLMGTLQLSRAVTDPKQSEEMIESGIEAALALAKM